MHILVCVPGVLAPFHSTVSSPVLGLDSRLRSVGGDSAAEDEEKKEESEEEHKQEAIKAPKQGHER